MNISRERLIDEATRTGYRPDVLEKVARLLGLLDKLLDHGEIDPTLLTDDRELVERIKTHPGLLWKAANVKSFKGRR